MPHSRPEDLPSPTSRGWPSAEGGFLELNPAAALRDCMDAMERAAQRASTTA